MKKVIISICGGNLEVIKKSHNVVLEIRDYDYDGVDNVKELVKDKDGDYYACSTH